MKSKSLGGSAKLGVGWQEPWLNGPGRAKGGELRNPMGDDELRNPKKKNGGGGDGPVKGLPGRGLKKRGVAPRGWVYSTKAGGKVKRGQVWSQPLILGGRGSGFNS